MLTSLRCGVASAYLGGLILVCGGCAEHEEMPLFPVKGKLLIGGKPTKGVLVFLRPLNPAAGATPVMPSGVVQEDGSFCLTTRKASDGAPAGEYIVTLASAPGISGVGDVDRRYKDAHTSPLRATIAPVLSGETNEVPLEIP
jgi:hypothetical protein